jgi:hypothetical protein
MAIAFDATTHTEQGSVSSFSFNHTCTGTDRILFVAVWTITNTRTTTAVTYNSVSMTNVPGATIVGSDGNQLSLWYLINPASGTNAVAVTCSGSNFPSARAVSYTGAQQSGVPDASGEATGTATNFSNSLTSVANDTWHVAFFTKAAQNIQSVSNGTIRGSASEPPVCADDPIATAGANTITANSSGSGVYKSVGVTFIAAPVAGPTTVKTWDGVTQSTGIKTYSGASLATTKSVIGAT